MKTLSKILAGALWLTCAALSLAQTNQGATNVPQLNSTFYVGSLTGTAPQKYPTIQSAVTAACATGKGAVVDIPPAYTGTDSITAVTGGCPNTAVRDEHQGLPTACYVWATSVYISSACSSAATTAIYALAFYDAFGDSINQGFATPSQLNAFPYWIGKAISVYPRGHGNVGGTSFQQDSGIYATPFAPNPSQLISHALGTNNVIQQGGSLDSNQLSMFRKNIEAQLAFEALTSAHKIYPAAMTKTGTWGASVITSSPGATCTGTGCAASFVVTGSVLYLTVGGSNGNTATASLSCTNGGAAASLTFAGVGGESFLSSTTGAQFQRILLLASGAHTCTITGTSAGQIDIEWAAGLTGSGVPVSDGPYVLAGGIPDLCPTNSLTATYAAQTAAAAAELLGDGITHVTYANPAGVLTCATDYADSSTHPTAPGQWKIAAVYVPALATVTANPSIVLPLYTGGVVSEMSAGGQGNFIMNGTGNNHAAINGQFNTVFGNASLIAPSGSLGMSVFGEETCPGVGSQTNCFGFAAGSHFTDSSSMIFGTVAAQYLASGGAPTLFGNNSFQNVTSVTGYISGFGNSSAEFVTSAINSAFVAGNTAASNTVAGAPAITVIEHSFIAGDSATFSADHPINQTVVGENAVGTANNSVQLGDVNTTAGRIGTNTICIVNAAGAVGGGCAPLNNPNFTGTFTVAPLTGTASSDLIDAYYDSARTNLVFHISNIGTGYFANGVIAGNSQLDSITSRSSGPVNFPSGLTTTTASPGDNSSAAASTGFVHAAIAAAVPSHILTDAGSCGEGQVPQYTGSGSNVGCFNAAPVDAPEFTSYAGSPYFTPQESPSSNSSAISSGLGFRQLIHLTSAATGTVTNVLPAGVTATAQPSSGGTGATFDLITDIPVVFVTGTSPGSFFAGFTTTPNTLYHCAYFPSTALWYCK
jgi:hypothetical protein